MIFVCFKIDLGEERKLKVCDKKRTKVRQKSTRAASINVKQQDKKQGHGYIIYIDWTGQRTRFFISFLYNNQLFSLPCFSFLSFNFYFTWQIKILPFLVLFLPLFFTLTSFSNLFAYKKDNGI